MNFIKWGIVLGMICWAFTCAQELQQTNEEVMVVDAAAADYDGKCVTLNGDVVVDHPLGKISAQNVIMIPPVEKKKLGVSRLKMDDTVVIALKEGGKLSCAAADLDCESLEGTFQGGEGNEYVVYTDSSRDSKGAQVPLVVKSKMMRMVISRDQEAKSDSPKNMIHDIIAERQVTVNYNHDFIIAADEGVYHRSSSDNPEASSGLPGTIILKAAEKGGVCQVTNRNGDFIRGDQISINTLKREIDFVRPVGSIDAGRSEKQNDKIDFSSQKMIWEDGNNALSLREHVTIQQTGLGKLTTEKQVRILQQVQDGKRRIQTITSEGKTILTRTDENKGNIQKLTCDGIVKVDHEHFQTTLERSKEKNALQVYYEDTMGQILSDKVVLDYAMGDDGLMLSKLTLLGNVKLVNSSQEVGGGPSQFALADLVEYFPKDREMILSANTGHRVLFFDKGNSLQVSAPKLKIRRGEGAKKETIQGLGDVRFNFMENEFEQLRKQFSLDKSNEG